MRSNATFCYDLSCSRLEYETGDDAIDEASLGPTHEDKTLVELVACLNLVTALTVN